MLFRRTSVAILLLATFAYGQQAKKEKKKATAPPTRKETIVVTGTYEPVPLNESDRTVDVIQIKQSPVLYRNWADALQSDPSLDLRQRAPGVQADLSIRGSTFGQTLVLVDGLRVNDAQSGHHNLDLPIPFASMQRVEVLHGSGSTLYGSDAVGGAVNFITGPPATSEFRLGFAGGNFGTNEQDGSAAYVSKKFSQQLSFTRDFSSGFEPDRDYRNLAIASETHFETGLGASTVLLGTSDRPFGADQFYGNFNSWERTKGWFAAGTQQLGKNTEAAFGYRRHTDEFILFRNDPSIYENNHITESWQAALRRHDSLGTNSTFFYGVEAYRDTIDSSNLGYHGRNQGALYADYDVRALRRFSFSVGARGEKYSGNHSQFSPSVSGGYWISSHLKLRASISHAFRLPTYTDLYYHDPANVGNPNLKPEHAWDYEGGLEWNLGARVIGELTVFHQLVRNGIDYVLDNPNDVWRAVNVDNINFTGVEALVRMYANHGQRIEVGYTGIHASQQETPGVQSRYVFDYPVHSASASWMGFLPGHVEMRTRLNVVQRYGTDAYPLVETAITRQFGRVQPYVQIINATNTGYEEIEGVRMPGRTVVVGAEVTLFRGHHGFKN